MINIFTDLEEKVNIVHVYVGNLVEIILKREILEIAYQNWIIYSLTLIID